MVLIAINKAVLATLKALSSREIDVKKNYQLQRGVKNAAAHLRLTPLFYKPWDHIVSYGDHEIPVRLFTPQTSGLHKVLLFFHGGGWVTGNINSYDRICRDMAQETDCMVVSVDYRLAPEHHFPAGLEDCYAIAREIYLDTSLFGVPPEAISLIGDSAGANLAAAVSLMARDRGEFLPSRQILIYPATASDHSETSPFPSVHENGTDYLLTSKRICDYMELYSATPQDFQNPYFAPLLAKDFLFQPDTLVITAEYDPLRDEGEAYAQELRLAGNKVVCYRMPDAVHGFFALSTRFAPVKRCYERINEFLAR